MGCSGSKHKAARQPTNKGIPKAKGNQQLNYGAAPDDAGAQRFAPEAQMRANVNPEFYNAGPKQARPVSANQNGQNLPAQDDKDVCNLVSKQPNHHVYRSQK